MFFDMYDVSMEEKKKENPENLSFPFFISIDCLLFQKITKWVNGTYYGFASRYWSSPKNQENPKVFSGKISDSKSFREKKEEEEEEDGEKLSSKEVKMVMENLGIFCSEEGEESSSFGSIDELSKLFEEKEPSLEEVKEAFQLFDMNRDGFIDAMELQRVLCVLGLKEGEKIENCKKMIESFDENKDGRIDFEEFVKFMESSF